MHVGRNEPRQRGQRRPAIDENGLVVSKQPCSHRRCLRLGRRKMILLFIDRITRAVRDIRGANDISTKISKRPRTRRYVAANRHLRYIEQRSRIAKTHHTLLAQSIGKNTQTIAFGHSLRTVDASCASWMWLLDFVR